MQMKINCGTKQFFQLPIKLFSKQNCTKVCVCVYVSVCVCVFAHVYACTCMHISVYVCMYVCNTMNKYNMYVPYSPKFSWALFTKLMVMHAYHIWVFLVYLKINFITKWSNIVKTQKFRAIWYVHVYLNM